MWLYIIAAILILSAAAALVRSHYEKKSLRTTEYTVESAGIPEAFDGVKLVYLSDLHDCLFGEQNEKLIREVLKAEPDYLILGGDMITVKPWNQPEFRSLRLLLDAFSGKLPIILTDGNHENRMFRHPAQYGDWQKKYTEMTEQYELLWLRDRTVKLFRGEEMIRLAAIDFPHKYYRKFHLPKVPESLIREKIGRRRYGFLLVCSHNPAYLDAFAAYGADLVLSGHNHGGTIRLPFVGGVMTPQFQFFSRYSYGRHEKDGCTEIISAGLGTHSINIRLFNKPEVTVIRLKRKEIQ